MDSTITRSDFNSRHNIGVIIGSFVIGLFVRVHPLQSDKKNRSGEL